MPSTRPPIWRLMVIDREIRSGKYPNAPRLAEQLEVSPRTVQRDLEFLRDSLNAPLEWSAPDNGYCYGEPTYFLPVQQLTEGDLLAVLVADKALSDFRGTAFEGKLRGIFDKLTQALPDEVVVSPQELAQAYSFQRTAQVRTSGEIFHTLEQAIRDDRTLEVLYHTQSRDVTVWRKMDPYHLANVDGEWYLLAFCHVNREVRVFRPSRIRQIKQTGEAFEIPSSFDAVHFLKTKFHVMGGENPVSIRIRFDPSLAGYITEREWSSVHRVQFLTDGGVDLTLTSENVDAVLRWVLNWGAGAEILSPPWVRRRVRETLKRLSERYEKRAPRLPDDGRVLRAAKKVYKPPSRPPRAR
jgi:predicted DNA-binding transcriptional regulator YafY